MRRSLAGLGLLLGLAALGLQASLTFPASIEAGRSALASIVFFFSFFTILTNSFLVSIYAAEILTGAGGLGVLRRVPVIGFGVPAITLVMGVYHFLLAPLWAPEGWWLVADWSLHYATPILFILWWALFIADGTLDWRLLFYWLVAPLIYLVYVMLRGAATGEYPYHILEIPTLGLPPVVANIGFVIVVFVALSAVAIGVDKLIGRSRTRQA